MKSLFLVFAAVCVLFMGMPDQAFAEVKLPSYASSGSADSKAQSVGKKVTDFASLIVGILSILGMLAGAAYFTMGNSERGWKFVSGGVIGLVIAGMVYGIAALVV